MMSLDEAIDAIDVEYARAQAEFPPFASPHEGFAILKEEVDELWDEVKKHDKDSEAMRKEAIQVGAMTLRFLTDI